MLQWSLRQHAQLWGGPESDFLAPLARAVRDAHALGSQRGKFHWLSGLNVTEQEFLKHVGYGINSLYTSRSGGLRWVEQTPNYAPFMSDIAALFPGAKFLLMIRDGRQVVHSLRHFVEPMEHQQACRVWRNHTCTGIEYGRSEAKGSVHIVRYENVVTDTEASLRDIYDFIGESYEPASAEFIRSKEPINSSFEGESTEDKLAPRWPAWTHEERSYFQECAGELLIELGYESDSAWVSGR